MKIGKSQLRQILIEELGDIISEQVTIEVNRQLRKKIKNSLKPEAVEAEHSFNELMAPHLESVKGSKAPAKNYTGNGLLDEMINTTAVPSNYYENASSAQNQTGPLNNAYRPTTVTDAADIDGENLNELENANFDAFL